MSIAIRFNPTLDFRQFRVGEQLGPPAQVELRLRALRWEFDGQCRHVVNLALVGLDRQSTKQLDSNSSQRLDLDELILVAADTQRIPQRPAEVLESNVHDISILKLHAGTEAQCARAEVMDMHVAGPAMRLELEVVMLEVLQAVAHCGIAGANFLRPEFTSITLDRHLAWN
jgi:hypothetical protein